MTSTVTDIRFGVNAGAAIKVPCRAATTAAITLSGEQTVDGVALVTGDRCLVKDQSSGVDNGIYNVDTGSWTRSPDFDGTYDAKTGTFVYITNGSISAGLFYTLSTADPITIGTTSLTFALISLTAALSLPLSLALGGTAATSAISALSGLGVIQVTAEAGTANAQTGTVDALVTALRADQLFIFTPSVTNTGATTVTFTPSGGGPLAGKNVFANGAACVGGELVISVPALLQYDGTQLNIIGGGPFVDASPLVVGSADQTKKLRLEVDGITTSTTRVWTAADLDIAVGKQPTRTVITSGTAQTYTTPTGCTRINVRMVGGGGGGGAVSANAGADGTDSTFSGATLTASKGIGGGTAGGAGGVGGTGTNGDINISGGGGSGGTQNSSASVVAVGGTGGNSAFGGGAASSGTAASVVGGTNSGGGGAGAGPNAGSANSGAGGGAGGYVEKLILAPSATYTYTVGAGGAGGAAGGVAGGNGAAGIIIVDEFYN